MEAESVKLISATLENCLSTSDFSYATYSWDVFFSESSNVNA